MDAIYKDSETNCCPRFDPTSWVDKEITFDSKLFLKDHVLSFIHIPLNFGAVMKNNMEKITSAEALAPEPLMLSDENSLFGSDVYIATAKNVPNAKMVTISGTFLSKVYEGQFKDLGGWVKDMTSFVKSKNKEMKKLYFFYTTCPACAKFYGKNYVVLLAQIK